MSYTLDLKKFFNDLRGPKGLEVIKAEANKLKSEFKHLGDTYRPQAVKHLKDLEKQYKVLVTKVQKAQSELDKEVKTTLTMLKNLARSSGKAKAASSSARRQGKVAKKASRKSSKKH